MKPVIETLVKYIGLLTALLLVEWGLMFFSPLNIPLFIPFTPINIDGLLLVVIFVWVLILMFRQVIHQQPTVSVIRLTLLGTLVCFVAEVLFQTVRSFTDDSDKLYHFLYAVIGVTSFVAFLAFLVAYQLKTKRTSRLVLFIIGFILLINVLIKLFPSIAG